MTVDDGYVALEKFGKDHWSTLAYAETVMVECKGFQVGFDPRMRQCRHHYRVMREQCRSPKRPTSAPDHRCMWKPEYATVLNDGSMVEGHDDWHCIQDMINAGLFSLDGKAMEVGDCEPGVVLHLSDLGRDYVNQLREHKARGGSFGTFKAPEPTGTPEMRS